MEARCALLHQTPFKKYNILTHLMCPQKHNTGEPRDASITSQQSSFQFSISVIMKINFVSVQTLQILDFVTSTPSQPPLVSYTVFSWETTHERLPFQNLDFSRKYGLVGVLDTCQIKHRLITL